MSNKPFLLGALGALLFKNKSAEGAITDHQMKVQDRLIKKAQREKEKKGIPKEVTDRMERISKDVDELEDFLNEL